jgi:hypothetical protein
VTPEPGDFFVTTMEGAGGVIIGTLESAVMDDWGDGPTHWRHAGVYLGNGQYLQAEPGGATIGPRRASPYDLWSTGVLPLTGPQRALVPSLAESYRGVGYSWLDYAALGAHHGHIPDLELWPEGGHLVTLQEFIKSTGHQMCSFMVDNFRLRLGNHLFSDGRWEGYVMPWDLGHLLVGLGA